MKANVLVVLGCASVGVAVGVGACAMNSTKPKKGVVIEDTSIFIPGTPVTTEDQNAVVAILQHYKKRLYKIQAYKNGQPDGQPRGTLADSVIGAATVAQVANDAQKNSLSGWTIQIGSATSSHPTQQPTPSSGSPQPAGSPSHPTSVPAAIPSGSPSHPTRVVRAEDDAAVRELVSKVAPILRKYSQ